MGDMADEARELEELMELDRLFGNVEVSATRHKYQPLTRQRFVWTDIKGNKHKLRDIDDAYLANIIRFLKRKPTVIYLPIINFLEGEQQRRADEAFKNRTGFRGIITAVRSLGFKEWIRCSWVRHCLTDQAEVEEALRGN